MLFQNVCAQSALLLHPHGAVYLCLEPRTTCRGGSSGWTAIFAASTAVRSILFRDRLRNGVLTSACVQRDHLQASDPIGSLIQSIATSKQTKTGKVLLADGGEPSNSGAYPENPVKISIKDSPDHRDVLLSTGPGLREN